MLEPQSSQQPPICILGMHRSGTSLVSQLLHHCGLNLGPTKTLVGPDEYNPTGYWEYPLLVDINDELLATQSTYWRYPPALAQTWIDEIPLQPYQLRVEAIFRNFDKTTFWGWKDPRTMLTLPFWVRMFPDVQFMFIFRNPLEVADSLVKRSEDQDNKVMTHEEALALWTAYHDHMFAALPTKQIKVFTNYDTYFYEPEAELKRVLQALGMPHDDTLVTSAVDRIRQKLHRNRKPHFLVEKNLRTPALQYYQSFCDRAGDVFQNMLRDDKHQIKQLENYAVELQDDLTHQRHEMQAQIHTQLEAVTSHQQQVRDREAQIQQQRQAINEQNAQLQQQQQIASHLNEELQKQQREILRLREPFNLIHKSLTILLKGHLHERFERSKIFKYASRLINRWSIYRVTQSVKKGRLAIPQYFDADWYLANYPDVREAGIHPYVHYWLFGWYRGYQPMPIFDTRWYALRYPEFSLQGQNPLEHYTTAGRLYGNRPCEFFDPNWYLENNPDVKEANIDPLLHFAYNGGFEQRHPSAEFDIVAYQQANPDIPPSMNPLTYYIRHQGIQFTQKRLVSALSDTDELQESFLREHDLPDYQPNAPARVADPIVKLIALYLPQFHPTPENDEFWGKGFTEWTNVSRARPLFPGHYQPRLPGALGFYDLRVVNTLREQAQLAREHGIYGFSMYRYWFNGKTVLDQPLELLLQHKDIDINYCLSWANENWTRRWDGMDSDILLEQQHTPEDDLAFITDAKRFFQDERYIRIDEKPILIIYNVAKIPDPQATAQRWRAFCVEQGYAGLYLIAVATHHNDIKAGEIGFDAVMQMPPHNITINNIANQLDFFVPFSGWAIDYEEFASQYNTPAPQSETLFRTVSPDWDNTARKGKRALALIGATADKYANWLQEAINFTLLEREPQERLVFINAWNEWAEGAYLEPDRKYGYTLLNTTSRVLSAFSNTDILIVAPNAARAGSQMVLLHLITWLVESTHLQIKVVLDGAGDLIDEYRKVALTLVLDEVRASGNADVSEAIKAFCGEQVSLIYANTCTVGKIVDQLPYDVPVLTHMHELAMSIKIHCAESMPYVAKQSDHFIAVAPQIISLLKKDFGIPDENISHIHEFITVNTSKSTVKRTDVVDDDSTHIVWGCGTANKRKGFDIFVNVAKQVYNMGVKNVRFCWIGANSPDYLEPQRYIEDQNAEHVVSYLGVKNNPRDYLPVGDIFFLSSREDPHPLVVKEAADSSLPTVCFDESGGIVTFVGDDAGVLVPYLDEKAASKTIVELLQNTEKRLQLGRQAREKFLNGYTREIVAPYILGTIRKVANLRPAVTVIVPAYRHASFLRQRLDSIYNQTFQDFEVILLDDASNDETPDILREYGEKRANTTVIINEENTGSTFSQWMKGLERAQGDLIWIAEDDDYCEPTLLEKLVPYFYDPDVKLAYCQSYAVDDDNNILLNYRQYTDDISVERWQSSYVTSADSEVSIALAKKNTIPNASAVLFRKFDYQAWADEWVGHRLAGDWAFYVHAMHGGKVAFHAEALNYHRRHGNTNIQRYEFDKRRFVECARAQRNIMQLYDVSDSVIEIMRQGSLENWQAVYPDKSEAEFETAYHTILHNQQNAKA